LPLYVVATPLGNLEDITRRAARVLGEVDEVLAEDTRHSRRLLDALGVRTPMRSWHDHSSEAALESIVERLRGGASLALITDAGTPCISDPGYRLVRAAQEVGVQVVPVPGPSAVVAFLSAAGLPTERFEFVGFVPRKAGERGAAIDAWLGGDATIVAYDSPQRVIETLAQLAERAPNREIAVGRELTKLHEEIVRGAAEEVSALFAARGAARGEFVIGVTGAARAAAGDDEIAHWVGALGDLDVRPRELARRIAGALGCPADRVYAALLALRGGGAG
jgi:16S rRNA (cytidine1402-2'-O)-methyltransferase